MSKSDTPQSTGPRGKRYWVAEFDRIDPVPCPCGEARRAFALPENEVATLHRTDISADSRAHYHKTLTEIYYVLEGEGYLELDGDRVSLQPGTAVFIPPLTRHRAVGKLRVLIVAVPTFDPNDEWFDDED